MRGERPAPLTRRQLLLVLVPSYAAAGLAVAFGAPALVRGSTVAWAAFGASALPIAARLRTRQGLEQWVLGVAGAVACTLLLAELFLYTGYWSPGLVLTGMAVISATLVTLPVRR